ncbi:MAG: hypothetical protein JXQ29_14145 [Planctomycetes bacterium]|nr:hypothetical protein [Planctomycetota bacterium]
MVLNTAVVFNTKDTKGRGRTRRREEGEHEHEHEHDDEQCGVRVSVARAECARGEADWGQAPFPFLHLRALRVFFVCFVVAFLLLSEACGCACG